MEPNQQENMKSTFPLFNEDALKHSTSNPISSSFEPRIYSRYNQNQTHQKINLEPNLQLLKEKRKRKPRNQENNVDNPNLTIKEIIENHQAGIPTEKEAKMKEERLKKMHEKKIEKKRSKAMDHSEDSNSKEDTKTTLHSVSSPCKTTSSELKMMNGKIVFEGMNDDPKEQNVIVIEDKKPKKLTSMSFKQRNHTEKWTKEETLKFYKAIEIFGSDFSMVAKLFPNRNRAQIKNKFRKEEKEKPDEIDQSFKKHRLADKTRFKETLKYFNTMLENKDELEEPKELGRNHSVSSTDSTDIKIMEDLKNIFAGDKQKLGTKKNTHT